MALKDIFKVSKKTFFNPRAWLGYDSLKEQTKTLWTFAKDATGKPTGEVRAETFEEAMQRLGVKEDDLKGIANNYLLYALIFVVLAVLDFCYGMYLLFHYHSFTGFILATTVCFLILVNAFKYHFSYFQIKNRKLGCSFEEWKAGKILNK